MTAPRLVVLLPARDCAGDLPGWLEAVRPLADAVVAPDDGSSDETAAILDAEPLVQVLLRNAPRPGFDQWNDSANRNRLLDAAATLSPDWIMSLDADERISPDDAAALRRFVDTDAEPGCAYGFQVFRMVEDVEHYDRLELESFRLFSWSPGQRFPERRFHFAPIPTSIGEERWVMTTVRIQHLATMSDDRRWARWQKYAQADPERRWQTDYTYALVPSGELRRWQVRPAGLSVTRREGVVAPWDVDLLDLGGPILSVIVMAARDDDVDLLQLVDTLVAEDAGLPIEVLLLDVSGMGTADLVRRRHPSVRALETRGRLSTEEAHDLALRSARGDYVLILSAADGVAPGTLARIVAAHESGHELVTGVVPDRSGEAGTPARASVPREATLALGTGRRREPSGPTVAQELFAKGLSTAYVEGLTFVRDPLQRST